MNWTQLDLLMGNCLPDTVKDRRGHQEDVENGAILAFRGREVGSLRRDVVRVGGGNRVNRGAGYPGVSLVTEDAEVRICSRGDEGLPSLCRLIERRGGLAYRVAGAD